MQFRTYNALFLFAGIGGGALGFLRARESMRGLAGKFRLCGAVDSDPSCAEDFRQLTGRPCTVADLGTMTPAELRAACDAPPDVIFTSPPCKGFSGCLPAALGKTPKYKDMNDLAVRGLFVALEAWPESPPKLILFENVPRIRNRGRPLLDTIAGMLQSYGYATRETLHDCGELGGLGQRRQRFLMVARHTESVPNFWHEPPKLPLKSVGDVVGSLPVPLPGSTAGGPMHALPRLSAMNWLRLALIPAGGDWRDLPESVFVDGPTAPNLPARAARQNGGLGVNDWSEPGHTVMAEGSVKHTWASVSDPRVVCKRREGGHGVKGWDQSSTPIIASPIIDNGPWQVADPRLKCDPRGGVMGVVAWSGPIGTIVANARPDNGAYSVADSRLRLAPRSTAFDVTDPRPMKPEATPVIFAADGTWHRPLTTLELAALQGFPVKLGTEWLALAGTKKQQRQKIGNAVPPPTAQAIGTTAIRAMLAAELGAFELTMTGWWVGQTQAKSGSRILQTPCQATDE